MVGVVDQSHATGFSHPVLVVALGGKASPGPVSTGKLRLVIITHDSGSCLEFHAKEGSYWSLCRFVLKNMIDRLGF